MSHQSNNDERKQRALEKINEARLNLQKAEQEMYVIQTEEYKVKIVCPVCLNNDNIKIINGGYEINVDSMPVGVHNDMVQRIRTGSTKKTKIEAECKQCHSTMELVWTEYHK